MSYDRDRIVAAEAEDDLRPLFEEEPGEEGRPVPGYVPGRDELLVLARHWAAVAADVRAWWRAYDQVGGDEIRRHARAVGRLGRIARLLGDEAVAAATADIDAAEEAAAGVGPP